MVDGWNTPKNLRSPEQWNNHDLHWCHRNQGSHPAGQQMNKVKKITALEILFFTRAVTQLTGWMLALLVSVKPAGFSFCYNNPHLSKAGRVRTQISTFDNRISWSSHSRYWCNTLELPKTLQKRVLDSDHCVQEVFCLLQWRRGQKAKPWSKYSEKLEVSMFNCWENGMILFFLLLQSESHRLD